MNAYSLDFRKKAMGKIASGISVRQVARNMGVHFTTIQNWKNRVVGQKSG